MLPEAAVLLPIGVVLVLASALLLPAAGALLPAAWLPDRLVWTWTVPTNWVPNFARGPVVPRRARVALAFSACASFCAGVRTRGFTALNPNAAKAGFPLPKVAMSAALMLATSWRAVGCSAVRARRWFFSAWTAVSTAAKIPTPPQGQ